VTDSWRRSQIAKKPHATCVESLKYLKPAAVGAQQGWLVEASLRPATALSRVVEIGSVVAGGNADFLHSVV
jgi:hypothetical protein